MNVLHLQHIVSEALELELPPRYTEQKFPGSVYLARKLKIHFFGSLKNITFAEEVFLHRLRPWFSSRNSHARQPLGTGRRLSALRYQGQIIRPSTNGPEYFSKETWHSVQKILKSYYTLTSFCAINSSEIMKTRRLNDANLKWSAHLKKINLYDLINLNAKQHVHISTAPAARTILYTRQGSNWPTRCLQLRNHSIRHLCPTQINQ